RREASNFAGESDDSFFGFGFESDCGGEYGVGCAAEFSGVSAAGGTARLQAVLAGGTSQHAGDCERGYGRGDWACGRRNEDDSRGLRRDYAAESFATGDCGTVWNASVSVSGTN